MAEIRRSEQMSEPIDNRVENRIQIRDIVQVTIVMLLWALCFPLITTGLSTSPPLHLAALRSLLAGATLLAAGILYKLPLLPERSTWLLLGIISMMFTTLGFTGMFLSGGRVTPGLATVIASTQPLLAALLGYFVLAERLTGVRGLALLVGFAGIVVIAMPGLLGQSANSTLTGINLVLVGASGVAIGNVLLKHIARQVEPLMAMAWILLLGSIPLFVAAVLFEQTTSIDWSVASVFNLVALSVPGTALAFVLWLDVLRRSELILLNTYTYLTPVFALIIGVLFYSEKLLIIELGGVVIVGLAVLLANRHPPHYLHATPVRASAKSSRRND